MSYTLVVVDRARFEPGSFRPWYLRWYWSVEHSTHEVTHPSVGMFGFTMTRSGAQRCAARAERVIRTGQP